MDKLIESGKRSGCKSSHVVIDIITHFTALGYAFLYLVVCSNSPEPEKRCVIYAGLSVTSSYNDCKESV